MKILFVCLGNICRSPLAEAIFYHKIKEISKKLAFYADSCGTSNYHVGDFPDHRTINNALKNGVKIDHVGRQIKPSDLHTFDLILAMDQQNINSILQLPEANLYREKIMLLRTYDPVSEGGDVPDPYYGGENGFQEVFDILDRSIENLIGKLASQ